MDKASRSLTILEKLDVQEKRIIDAYREGIIDLGELKIQKESHPKPHRRSGTNGNHPGQ